MSLDQLIEMARGLDFGQWVVLIFITPIALMVWLMCIGLLVSFIYEVILGREL